MKTLKRTALATGIAMALSGTAYADLNSGLIVYLPFNGNALDESGNARHGTEHGQLEYVPSQFGQAVKFEGNLENYITVAHDEALNFKGSFTISLWIYRIADPEYGLNVDSIVVGKGRDCFNSYLIARNGTKFKVKTDGDCRDWSSTRSVSSEVPQNEWHLVTAVFDKPAETIKYYLDGVLKAENYQVADYQVTNEFPLVIGKLFGDPEGNDTVYSAQANVDELRLYNRALSECEINTLHTGKNECPTSAVCQLYGVQDNGLNDSQLFTINPDTLNVNNLGELYPDYDIEALDTHPDNDELYAASGDDTNNPGTLYKVNTQTGALTEIGNTGFAEIEGLSFDTEGTLWAWAKGDGLISVNTQTGAGTLIIPSPVAVEDITWNNDNTLLYAAQDTHLWVYDGKTVEKACDLPGHTEALEMLPNNTLLVGIHGQTKLLELQAIDLTTCETVLGLGIPTDNDDMEGIAWPVKACTE
jgi:hypothetical protein